MTHAKFAELRAWTAEPLSPSVVASLERLRASEGVVKLAVMPDVHLGPEVCNGVVLATQGVVYPAAVGRDIGCGVTTVLIEADADLLAEAGAAADVLSGLQRRVPSLMHRVADAPESDVVSGASLSAPLRSTLAREGRLQLGTLGRGNHFLEFQRDEEGRLWVMVHSGSRAMGQAIAQHHLRGAQRSRSGLGMLEVGSQQGRAYLQDMAWAVQYAAASRRRMLEAACDVLARRFGVRADEDSWVDCCHNFVSQEAIGGRSLWNHRKGALSAHVGVPGLIPGSMGTHSLHVEGRGCEDALCSSSHGAGRAMSRAEARKSLSVRALHRQMGGVWFDHRHARRLLEEAPRAYKDIGAVMRAQRRLTRIVRRVTPVLVYKGV